jgi:hypothetical protein
VFYLTIENLKGRLGRLRRRSVARPERTSLPAVPSSAE